MSDIKFTKTHYITILFYAIMVGVLLQPVISYSQERSVLLDRIFRVNKTSPRVLYTYSDPENINLDFEVYVVFDKKRGLVKIGFNPKVGMDSNLIEKIGEINVENINSYVNRSFTAQSGKLRCIATIKNFKKYLLTQYENVKGHQYRLKWVDIDVQVETVEDILGK